MIAKYVRIADDLRQAIERGDHPPGSTLPGETELVSKYQVSRGTVRQAIAMLTNEGLVTPMPGIGTIVRETIPIEMAYTAAAASPTWATSNAGDSTASDQLVSAAWEAADTEIADRLDIPASSRVLHRIRHQSRGAGVAQVMDQWIPEPVVTAIRSQTGTDLADKDNLPTADLFTLMKQAAQPPAETTETIGARMPSPTERDLLQLPPGVPVLTTLRVTRDKKGTPLETSDFVSAADRITQSFTVSLTDR
jgi:GntR family transcriptional regulator